MSKETLDLIQAFEALPSDEKIAFANVILQRLPPIDSGELSNDVTDAAGDELARMLEEEENGSAKG